MITCPACAFSEIASGTTTCPKCGGLLENALPEIKVDIKVGRNLGGQVTGVNIEQIGYRAGDVQAMLSQIRAEFIPRPFTGECPYRGLEPFEEEDAGVFFGREALTDEVIQRIRAATFLMVSGNSGSVIVTQDFASTVCMAGLERALRVMGAA